VTVAPEERYVAWFSARALGRDKGAFASHGRRLIVSGREDMAVAFAEIAEVIPLETVDVHEWLISQGFVIQGGELKAKIKNEIQP
jgi:hypothetical protein